MKPKWKNEDHEIRHQAVMNMSEKEIDHLKEVVLTDPNEDIAIIALKKIHNIDILNDIINNTTKTNLKQKAEKKLIDLLKSEIIKKHKSEYIDWINDEKILVEIVITTTDQNCQNKAFAKISSEDNFYKIALSTTASTIGLTALEHLNQEDYLKSLSKKAKNKKVKKSAGEKNKNLYANTDIEKPSINSTESIDHEKELESIANYAEKVKNSDDFEKFSDALDEKVKIWSSYDPYGASEFAPRFYSAIKVFETRKKEHKEKLEAEAKKEQLQKNFREQKQTLCKEIETMTIQSDTQSSLTELRKRWLEIMLLDDEDEEKRLNERFERALQKLNDKLKRFADETIKYNELCEKLKKYEEILKSEVIGSIKKQLTTIPALPRFQFIDLEKIKQLKNDFEDIKQKARKIIKDFENKLKEENNAFTEQLKELLAKIPPLFEEENHRKATDTMKNIQQKWKELNGNSIPKFAKTFKQLSDEFWLKQREYNDEEDWNRWANKNQKNALINIVERTAELADIKKVADIIRKAQNKWKAIGPVPHQDNETMWNRFHKACEDNYARCKAYFEELDKKRADNLEYCKNLIVEAEEAGKNSDLKIAVNRFKELNSEWKAHSMLPKGEGDELYKQFRSTCDEFFKKYGEFREDIDSHREENQKKREEIITQITELTEKKDFNISKCLELQKQMQSLGPGLKDKDKETWQEYRKVCDTFFENIDKDREKNIPQKEAICKELEETLEKSKEDKKELTSVVNHLLKKWRQIGHLPKKHDKVLSEKFYKLCAKALDIDIENIDILEEKKRITEAAEEMVNSTQWRETTENLRSFQIKWNIISYGSGTKDEELWKRFRTACDTFFKKKKEHFEKSDEQKIQNLIEKEGLITRIEMLAAEKHGKDNEPSTKTNKTASISLADELQMAMENNFIVSSISGSAMHDEIKRIQEQWKKIGYVPRDKENELWNRYRQALDAFYDNAKKS
jgi:hypothetical protein